MTSTRPTLTIAQAVDQFEISRATLRRGIDSGRFPNAAKDSGGRWGIPLDDLIGAGVKGRKTWLNEGAHQGAHQGGHPAHNDHPQGAHNPAGPLQKLVASELAHEDARELAQGARELAHELAEERRRVALLEAQLEGEKQLRAAAERNADDLRSAMRMIEAGTTSPPVDQPRRRWWQRS